MTKEELMQMAVKEPDPDMYAAIRSGWDRIAKPLDGMGEFEPLICRIGAILEDVDVNIRKKAVIVMCADNGITEEGVCQSESVVTAKVAASMGRGTSSVCRMAASVGADVIPVDIGMCCEETPAGVLPKRAVNGTKNFAKEPAMTEGEVLAAIGTGIDIVKNCKEEGYRLIAAGEMGIGNTTTGSAVAAALTGWDAESLTGRGAGLSDAGLSRKKRVIRDALETYGFCPGGENQKRNEALESECERTLRVLSCVGGADIAGMTGVFLGGALFRIPVIVDGLISSVAALAAERLVPGTKAYILPSHLSREPAAANVAELLELNPVIHADLALGEGTGAVMMFALLDLAAVVYSDTAAFSEIRVERYRRYGKAVADLG